MIPIPAGRGEFPTDWVGSSYFHARTDSASRSATLSRSARTLTTTSASHFGFCSIIAATYSSEICAERDAASRAFSASASTSARHFAAARSRDARALHAPEQYRARWPRGSGRGGIGPPHCAHIARSCSLTLAHRLFHFLISGHPSALCIEEF